MPNKWECEQREWEISSQTEEEHRLWQEKFVTSVGRETKAAVGCMVAQGEPKVKNLQLEEG